MNSYIEPCGCLGKMGHALNSRVITKPCAYHKQLIEETLDD